jgi:exopolyphosphatase/guanosine-5'-triphosphate,3'-diphosphate pyrophosphatase
VHLLAVDAHHGGSSPYSEKSELRLAERIGADGQLTKAGADALVDAVARARDAAARHGTEDLLAFATSAVRDATNSAQVLRRVRDETGVEPRVLSGEAEAIMTFLAVRRWYGWSAGRLLVLDIGGGSLEIAVGIDEEPDAALSLPLGAGRLTRELFRADPPPHGQVERLREQVRAMIGRCRGWSKPGGTAPSPRRRPSGPWPG